MKVLPILAVVAVAGVTGFYTAKQVYAQSACTKVKKHFAQHNWEGDISCSAGLAPFGMSVHVRAEKLQLQETNFSAMNWSGAEKLFNAPIEVYFGKEFPLQPEFIVKIDKSGAFVREDFPPYAS